MGRWRRDLDEVRAYMDRERGRTILAGDFNATLRHGGLGSSPRWADALTSAGSREGTWPSSLPAALASPIDHVFVNSGASVVSAEVIGLGGSDHNAVAARVAF